MDRIAYKLAAERKAREKRRINYNALQIPKGKTVRQVKARKDREDAKQLKAVQSAVWSRERSKLDEPGDRGYALCQRCGSIVWRWVGGNGGHVHHVVSRRHKATRYDPANAELLCRTCHNKLHGREF